MEGQLINQYLNEKAGMEQVDKRTIAQTIERLTAGTPKSLHQKEMQEKRAIQAVEMLNKCLSFTVEQKQEMKKDWWKEINQLRMDRVLDRYWAHLDFDMFYIACELLEKPQLKDKPCAVGGKNSVLCTANYEARKFGLRAAMPSFIAVQLCPQVILFQPNFTKYKHFSNIFRAILQAYDPQLQSHGLDEAYVDLTNHLKGKSLQQIQDFIQNIRNDIYQKTGLTVSCGVGANKMLAKIASQERKPNNQFILQNNGKVIQNFLSTKKIRKIPGIGPVNQYFLKQLGVETVKDIIQNIDILSICFSQSSVEFFVCSALGIGSIQHEFKERKSVGKSQTFKVTDNMAFLEDRLQDLCEQVSMELQQLGFLSLNVVVSYQTHNFQKRDKTFKLSKYTDSKAQLFEAIIDFVKSNKFRLRLLGVKCSSLIKVEQYKKQQLINYLNQPKKMKELKEQQKNSTSHIKSLMRDEVADKGKFLCPICNQSVDTKGNISMFNRHVDRCLTKSENNTTTNPPPTTTSLNKQETVKSKSIKSVKQSKSDESKTVKTLHSFFKKP